MRSVRVRDGGGGSSSDLLDALEVGWLALFLAWAPLFVLLLVLLPGTFRRHRTLLVLLARLHRQLTREGWGCRSASCCCCRLGCPWDPVREHTGSTLTLRPLRPPPPRLCCSAVVCAGIQRRGCRRLGWRPGGVGWRRQRPPVAAAAWVGAFVLPWQRPSDAAVAGERGGASPQTTPREGDGWGERGRWGVGALPRTSARACLP